HVEGGLLGPCATGVTSCAGGPMECVQTVFPSAETCNGVDDDCDGSTDEDQPPGGEEVCNGLDDDCDDVVDEGLGTLSCGTGACARTVDACVGGSTQTCVPGIPSEEACNGLDDDCDGQTDEGLGSLSCGTGVCARTVAACSGGSSQTCVPGAPAPEACNGLDDDCDGQTDEEAAWSGLLQPVNQDGSSIFQQKSTIPLKFRLTKCSGEGITTATATLEVVPISNTILGTVDEGTLPNARADIGDVFRFDLKGNQFVYNLASKSLIPGRSYLLRIRINGGPAHETVISLK
ncbi:MAG TPA: MopE-related protein, partial [Candidatus Polarisedimenticolia bacterium]|nr:MopE-related protein [Candidatus Polarisedimenticolia bacterium]